MALVSRRHVLGGLAALPFATPSLPAATSRVDRVMVQGRPQQPQSPYRLPAILAAMDQLGGVRRMRCREPFAGTPGWRTYVGLARHGVQFCFTLSARDIRSTIADLRAFLDVAPRSIWAIEGPNEPDLNPVRYNAMADRRLGFRTGDAPALMAYMRAVTFALRRDPVLRTIPVIACNDFMQVEQAPFTTFGNTHIYPKPGTDIARRLAGFGQSLARAGHAQGVITEWGRSTGIAPHRRAGPLLSPSRQADLLASDLAQVLARRFVNSISIYELFSWHGTGEMANFGLFERDGRERPAAAAIRAIID